MTRDLPITVSSKFEQSELFEYKGKMYDVSWESSDTRHGSPFDRGSADSYYGRPPHPHYFEGGTNLTPKIERSAMSKDEIDAYYAGYEYNENYGDKKEW